MSTEVSVIRVGDYRAAVVALDNGRFGVVVSGVVVLRRNNLGGVLNSKWVRCPELEPTIEYESAETALAPVKATLEAHVASLLAG